MHKDEGFTQIQIEPRCSDQVINDEQMNEPDYYTENVECVITGFVETSLGGGLDEVILGSASLTRFRINEFVDNVDRSLAWLFDVDGGSYELHYNCPEIIEDETLENRDVVLFRNIEIEPQYRGKGVLPLFVRWLTRCYSASAPRVLLYAFPKQFTDNVTDENLPGRRAETDKLIACFERQGFKSLAPGHPYMQLDLTN